MTAALRPLEKPCRLRRIGFAGLLLAGLSACAPPSAKVDLTGNIQLFGPLHGFSLTDLSDDWVALGADPEDHAVVSATASGPSIKFLSSPEPYVLVRRIDASLLATPFLSWSWQIESIDRVFHPARITIGLRDLPESDSRWRGFFGLGSGLPKYDRTITLAWSNSALMRGSMSHIISQPASVRYVVRGGQENAGRWWRETVDLSQIHAAAWPDLKRDKSRLVFIGVAVTADPSAGSADFSDIKLSR